VTDRQTDRQTELLSQRPCNAERRTVKTVKIAVCPPELSVAKLKDGYLLSGHPVVQIVNVIGD